MYLQVKSKQIKMIQMNHIKMELSGGLSAFHSPVTTSLSSVLVFLLNTDSVSSFAPGQFYFLLPHIKPCLMPIGLNSNLENIIPGRTAAWVLRAPKYEFKAFSGLAFLRAEFSYTK